MRKRKWMITTGAFLLVALMATGYLAIAAEYGSKDDPLVTLSYITDVLSPDMLKQVEAEINSKADGLETELNSRLDSYSTEISQKIADYEKQYAQGAIDDTMANKIADIVMEKMKSGGSPVTPAAGGETWQVVKVPSGKTMMLPLGAEVVLRIGSGTCYSTGSVGLVNLSSGATIGNGAAVAANNLYLVTIDSGRGVKATSEMTVLVKGAYTIP